MRIELSGVGKRYGRVAALRGVDLDLPSGSRTALIGPNGSGKSTLIRVLMGLVAADGRVRLDGACPRSGRVELARRLAYVPQTPPAFSAPVRELVAAVCCVRDLPWGRVAERTRALGLDLDEVAARPFRGLSGGMKQKLLIALALAADTTLVLLDEPTASLDAEGRERFFELFERVSSEATLVLCSHRLEEIRRLVDRVVLLEDGRVAWEGAAEDYLDARGVTVVELLPSDEEAARWLAGHGFRAGVGGWWVAEGPREAAVTRAEEAVGRLGGRLREVIVRPLEHVGPKPEEGA